jgi:hypothetical protein
MKKYIQIETLDRSTVVELIEKITVSEQYFIDGERFQDVRVKYKFIGEIPSDPRETKAAETNKKQSA